MNCALVRLFVCRLVSVVSVLMVVSLSSNAQTYIFGRADFPVGNSPNAIATGDFNGDGVLDVAVTNSYDNTVSILLGRVNATFAPQVTYPTGALPVALVAADFNGDGNLDLAVTNGNCTPPHESELPQCSPSTISILLGDGDGTFQPQVTYSVGTLPASIVTSDFNGDGKLDLAVVNVFDNNISILLGNGDGTFQPAVNYTVALQASYFGLPALVLGDFNADGKMDLAVAGTNAVNVLLGNGNGTFQSALQSTCTCTTTAMATGDFNGDGKLDLVVFSDQGGTEILLGFGNGTFYLNASYNTAGTGGIAVADLNGDGKLDLIIPQDKVYQNYFGNQFAVQLGNGDGTFGNPFYYGTGPLPLGIVLGDFNGDGKLDVALADAACGPPCTARDGGFVSVVLGFGDGTFVGATQYSILSAPYSNGSMLSADFRNDGNLDIAVVQHSQSSVGVLLGNADGTLQAETSYSTAQSTGAIATGDLRNNGDLDLVSANNPCTNTTCPPGTVSVLLGNGDGTFQTHVDYAAGIQPWSVALGSFRNNGNLDIAVSNYGANTVSILLGNGDGTFQPQAVYGTGSYPQQIAIGDFNKDNYPDLAIATNSGVSVLLGNGDGTFKSQTSYGTTGSAILAADFNGDGNLDLAVSPTNGAGGFVLLGNGDGTFQNPIAAAIVGQSLNAADFNGDGKLDLASAELFTDDVLVALGNGDGTFQSPTAYLGSTLGVGALTVDDFNGDGVPDLAAGGGSVSGSAVGMVLSTPFKSISPSSLNFGSQGVGTNSPSQTISLSNPSNVQFNISSIAASGSFAETNTCGTSLAIGQNCTITVTFSPPATGSESGAIVITDSTRISPVSVPLTGNGVSGSFLTPFPARQNFPPQAVGTKSSAAAIQLMNTGNASLSITGIALSGTNSSDFTQTNNCGSSIAAGSSCTATVTFTPQAPGSRSAMLSISDNVSGSPQTAMLTGTGLGPFAAVNKASLTFSSQVVGTTSAAQAVTLTNTGNAALNVTGITASQSFGETNTCGTALAVGSSCQISVTFSPSTAGTITGAVTVSDNVPGSPQTISLTGNSTATPGFSLGPASGSPTTQTISAGQSAKFSVAIAPSGSFSGTVSLSCGVAPVVSPAPSCSLSNSSVQITSGTSQNVSVTIATTAASTSTQIPFSKLPPRLDLLILAGAFSLCGFLLLQDHKRRRLVAAPVVALLLAGGLGCGGSSTQGVATNPGTPAGSYTATVTAVSGNSTSSTVLTVVVQ